MASHTHELPGRWSSGIHQVLIHLVITVAAVGIAFSLPVAARYILYQWWPKVAEDYNLLLATEVVLAASLVLLFNVARLARENRRKGTLADLASLVHVRSNGSWLARWRERGLLRRLATARDAFILTITGYDTFADAKSPFNALLGGTYEIRVMLLNPYAPGAERRVSTLPEEITLENFVREVESSIAHLAALRATGKKVALRFYDREPFWKVAVLGDHVWVQYCHSGCEVRSEPEYIFAHNRTHPRRGFFAPFYMHFLEQWDDPRNPEYDFDTGQLVHRDAEGREVGREPFGGGPRSAEAAGSLQRAAA
jgi:hypothetical protein